MNALTTATGLSLVLLASAPAAATSLSIDLPNTSACYSAAELRDATQFNLRQCNAAISRETTTSGVDRAANLVNRGILLLVLKNNQAAGRDFDEALSIDPRQPEAWLGKAIERWQSNDSANAVTMATRALRYGPDRPAVAYLIRGLANEEQGNLRAAYADLNAAHRIDPRWQEPIEQLSRYRVVQRP